ncbi:hypothetical protein [Massilia sp. TSP1-1-2]|uniref:hypothetical protein n=1 Tax=unclassified Massilia TaxID=2609279 RepID=UPI003CEEF01E
MTIDLDSRRSIRKIACADFAAYPVWEWAINEGAPLGDGDSFLRPTSLDSLGLDAGRHYVVSATATLSEGSVLPACVEVSVRGNRRHVEPMFIFLQERHLDFGGSETKTVLSHYTKRAGCRPLRWTLAVPFAGGTVLPSGMLRESLLSRVTRLWTRLRRAAVGKSVLVP